MDEDDPLHHPMLDVMRDARVLGTGFLKVAREGAEFTFERVAPDRVQLDISDIPQRPSTEQLRKREPDYCWVYSSDGETICVKEFGHELPHGDGSVSFWDDDDVDIHSFFGLTYANYLVLHRTVLQSMPREWQLRFTKMVEEAAEFRRACGYPEPDYEVRVKTEHGRYAEESVPHYNRGRTIIEPLAENTSESSHPRWHIHPCPVDGCDRSTATSDGRGKHAHAPPSCGHFGSYLSIPTEDHGFPHDVHAHRLDQMYEVPKVKGQRKSHIHPCPVEDCGGSTGTADGGGVHTHTPPRCKHFGPHVHIVAQDHGFPCDASAHCFDQMKTVVDSSSSP